MEVILLEDIAGLGARGSTVTVRDGFARNFLVPKKKALVATPPNRRLYEQLGRQKSTKETTERTKFSALAEKIASVTLETKLRWGEEGKAFGAVTKEELTELLKQAGVEVDRHLLMLDEPIREPGVYMVGVRLSEEFHPEFRVTVVEDTRPE